MNDILGRYIGIIIKRLDELVPECTFDEDVVHQAMKYSLSAGGKRIRPVLVLEFCRICGGNTDEALDLACAVEFIHTYSLIHDDLPCMDDDDLRRGKPSCHVKFGYANALLAGDALLTRAFGIVSESCFAKNNPAGALKVISALSELAGCNGMIGGQVRDLFYENKEQSAESLRITDSLKTGAMIKSCALIGAVSANADKEKLEACVKFAEKIGLAFQVTDDILDVTGDEEEFGKPIGSDAKSGKCTYVSILGIEKSKEFAQQLTNEAICAIEIFGEKGAFLKDLALRLIERSN